MRERYDRKYPFQIVTNQHLIQQGYKILSTSGFTNRLMYSRYVDQDKTFGRIRRGGFDVVMIDREERLIGAEVKPEFSLNEFQRALGEVIFHLTSPFWKSRVDEAMIIMPLNNSGNPKLMMSKKRLLQHFTYVLESCRKRGYHVSMKFLSVPCRIAHF